MARTKRDLSCELTVAFLAGLALIPVSCQPSVETERLDTRPPGGGGGSAQPSGGSQELGGAAGSGTGGGAGFGGTSSPGLGGTGGRADGGTLGSTGGQTSAGGRPSGGTGGAQVGSGGQSGSGGATKDAGPDGGPRDALADHLQIPDLANASDAPAAFWSAAFAANCTPAAIGGRAQADGHHRAGEDCMRSGCHLNPKRAEHHAGTDCRGSGCHANGSPDGSGAPAFLFGGTVYGAVTLAAAAGVQVGVRANQSFYSACSASNGNFWGVAASGTSAVTWSSAKVRVRNGNGEAPMMTTAAAGCNANACHRGTLKMTAP